jgi:hypothetical protein
VTTRTTSLLDRVLAAVPAGTRPDTSHLLGPDHDEGPYALRHAVKQHPARAAGVPDDGLSRWLVWLGPARPPRPPSHLRLGLAGPRALGVLARLATDAGRPPDPGVTLAGLLLPLAGGVPLLVVSAGPARTRVLGVDGPAWGELQVYGRLPRHPEPDLRLAGLTARPHHRQVLPAGDRPILLVRPEPIP